ncbi:MAG: hypothetical protein C0505_16700 [Leptothrix sp. (in: Bacteria)]|nr:hypothetical protein [Leptothrix sp. (in: b-proteobacteria)]
MTRHLAALCLAACSWASQAETLRVDLTADFQLPPMSPAPGTLSLAFSVDEPLSGVAPQGNFAFTLSDVIIAAAFNGSVTTSTVNTVGWFDYGGSSYWGIDIRMADLLVPGDLMQLILGTPMSLYSGTTAAPTLERLSLTDLFGSICYYGTGSGACTAQGSMSSGTYAVSVVPEPQTVWLLSLGLLVLAGRTWRLRQGDGGA